MASTRNAFGIFSEYCFCAGAQLCKLYSRFHGSITFEVRGGPGRPHWDDCGDTIFRSMRFGTHGLQVLVNWGSLWDSFADPWVHFVMTVVLCLARIQLAFWKLGGKVSHWSLSVSIFKLWAPGGNRHPDPEPQKTKLHLAFLLNGHLLGSPT